MKISVSLDFDTGLWTLMVASKGMSPTVAGDRLRRGGEWPDIKFTHETEAGAKADAARLQGYLDTVLAKKQPSKKEIREVAA